MFRRGQKEVETSNGLFKVRMRGYTERQVGLNMCGNGNIVIELLPFLYSQSSRWCGQHVHHHLGLGNFRRPT